MSAKAARVITIIAATACFACGPSASTATPVPVPTSTTIAMSGSPCAPTSVRPERFENYVVAAPSPTTRPPFAGTNFTGLGKVVSAGTDSVVLELADNLFRAFGPTTVKVSSTTNLDRDERAWTLVAADGVAAGATEVPLTAGAPAIDAGEHVVFECHRGAGVVTGESGLIAQAASASATTWKLSKPLQNAWPIGTMVWYDRFVHHASLAELRLAAGQSVYVEMTCTTASGCAATKLSPAGVSFGYRE